MAIIYRLNTVLFRSGSKDSREDVIMIRFRRKSSNDIYHDYVKKLDSEVGFNLRKLLSGKI